jgi:hypothetical protein
MNKLIIEIIANKYQCDIAFKLKQMNKYFEKNIMIYELHRYKKLDDDIIKNYSNIKMLLLNSFDEVTDEEIKKMTNLEGLSLSGDCKITNISLEHLIKLKYLYIYDNKNITTISNKNLEYLRLRNNDLITDKVLPHFLK